MKHMGNENSGKDHQLKHVLIVKEILLISIIKNVWRVVQSIYMVIAGFKGLRQHVH